jgi:DNA-binding NtrC family response regulator
MNALDQTGAGGAKSPVKNPERTIHILIVDDHGIIRQGLKQILSDAFKKAVFGEAENGNEALKKIPEQPWDIVLLDISMPGGSGLDVLKQLVEARPAMAVLVLSMHPEDQFAVRALKLGAAGRGLRPQEHRVRGSRRRGEKSAGRRPVHQRVARGKSRGGPDPDVGKIPA